MFKGLIAVSLFFSIHCFANPKAEEAALNYSQRDFNATGIEFVRKAIQNYDEAIAIESDEFQKKFLTHEKAVAFYFLGTALTGKEERKDAHQVAMDLADDLMTGYGVDADDAHEMNASQVKALVDALDDQDEALLADVFYTKAINLGQWGQLNGIVTSIGRLPIVKGLVNVIQEMGYASIHAYGPLRTLGRIDFVLPALLGGDLANSEALLREAFRGSLVEEERYSFNGYNNIYLAETMYKRGKEKPAIRILEMFVEGDFEKLGEKNIPENREAIRQAQELLKEWK